MIASASLGIVRRRGYRPDPVGHRATSFDVFRARFLGGAGTPPTTANTLPFVSRTKGGAGILNQGQTGSCTGHGKTGAFMLTLALAGIMLPETLSPIAPYTMGRRIDVPPNADGSLVPLADEGAEPNQVIRAVGEFGCPLASEWGNYPADPATINLDPTDRQLKAASRIKLDGSYKLLSTGDQLALDVMSAIAFGKVGVTFAIYADSAFESYTGGIITSPPDTTDPNGGGHYVYLADYTWDGKDPASVVFWLVNSWSDQWGEAGMARVGRGFFDATLGDVYANRLLAA